MRVVAIAALALALGACAKDRIASFEASSAAKACAKAGYPSDHPQHQECVGNTVAAWKQQGGDAAAVGLIAGAVAAGSPGVTYSRRAPLVAQQTAGYQRICTYQTASGPVSLTLGIAQTCPADYAY